MVIIQKIEVERELNILDDVLQHHLLTSKNEKKANTNKPSVIK